MQTGKIKKTINNKITTISIKILCLSLLFFPVSGYSSYAAIVLDADTGNIINETNANQLWYPASLTKVMTLYLVFKALKSSQIKLNDKLTASKLTARQPKSKLGIKQGERLTVKQTILAIATRSANDAAFMMAEHMGKTEKSFARKMTKQAKALGMNNTVFLNSTGLPNVKQVTTVRDMAILAQAMLRDFPEYYKYFSTPRYIHKKKTYVNINQILNVYSGADGIKTGFTCGSGYNLMASAKRKGQRLIAILMGAKNSRERTKKMKELLDIGFSKIGVNPNPKKIVEQLTISLKPAIHQLSSTQCRQGISNSSYSRRVSGWTIIFGAFVKKSQAKQLIKTIKPKMGKYAKYGRPSVIKRMNGGVMLWHAVWSGMKKEYAGKACKTLWDADEYCHALHPKLVSNKRAQWR